MTTPPPQPTTNYHTPTPPRTQGLSRNSYLYSMELAVYGQACLGLTLLLRKALSSPSSSSHALDASSAPLLQGWTAHTWIPILTQAAGGVIVGLVTKHAGGVKKGFALIAGIALTAFVQAVVQVGGWVGREGRGGGGKGGECVCVCVCVCWRGRKEDVCVCLCLSVCLSVCLSACLSVSVCVRGG